MIARLQDLIWTVISSNPLIERLAIASIDLVVVTALVAVIVAVARIRSRRVVALLWLVALIKPILSLAVAAPVPLIPLHARARTPPPATAVETPARAIEFRITTQENGAVIHNVDARTTLPSATAAPAAPTRGGVSGGEAAAAAWLAGVLVMMGAGVVERLRLRRVVAASVPAGDDVTARVGRIARTMRRATPPRALVTGELESPALAGTFCPVILLPAWIVDDGHGDRLEWALRHELAHWHARDHLANLASEAARALFFFHPAAWWAARRWKEAMEMACDESVVADRRDVKRYAEELYRILAHVDERRRLALSSSLFATRTQIGRRIETLLRTQRTMARPGAVAIALVCVFAAATFAVGPDVSPRPPRPPRAPHTGRAAHGAHVFAVSPAPPSAGEPTAPVIAGRDEQNDSGNVSYDNVNVNANDDDYDLRLRAEGIEFAQNTGRVVSLREDGYLKVRETTGDIERRVIITPDEDGGLHAIYTVDGARAEWNDDAQAWLAGILRHHLTRVRNHNQLIMTPPAPRAFAAPRAAVWAVPSPEPTPAPAPPGSGTPPTPPGPETAPKRK
jgi:beta-lactamase regulating signal transducer with metallopeptidase domain